MWPFADICNGDHIYWPALHPEDKFCKKCGAPKQPYSKQSFQCIACSSEVEREDKFCLNCGTPVNIAYHQKKRNKLIKKIIFVSIIIVLLLGWMVNSTRKNLKVYSHYDNIGTNSSS